MSDFDLMVHNAWAKMFGELDIAKQESIRNIIIETQDNPTPVQLAITRTPKGHTLLGMYYNNRVILFKEPIITASQQHGINVESLVDQVMRHEIWQHHLGTNHTVRPSAPKSLDEVYKVLDSVGEQVPYEYARPARCCPDRGW